MLCFFSTFDVEIFLLSFFHRSICCSAFESKKKKKKDTVKIKNLFKFDNLIRNINFKFIFRRRKVNFLNKTRDKRYDDAADKFIKKELKDLGHADAKEKIKCLQKALEEVDARQKPLTKNKLLAKVSNKSKDNYGSGQGVHRQ